MRLALLLVVLLASLARADDAPAADTPRDRALDRLRLAPFASPRSSYFYSGFGLPRLREAWGGAEGELTARLRSSQTHSADTRDVDGRRDRIDAVYIEHLRLDLSLAVHDRVTLFGDLRVAGWDERRDVFRIFDETGALTIQGEAAKVALGRSTSRHENLAVVMFGALVTLVRGDDGVSGLGASLAIKLPGFRRGDLTSSGTGDAALTAHGSLLLVERVALHANAGVVAPMGRPWIFEDEGLTSPHAFLQTSLGVTVAVTEWLSLGASVEAETSPWDREVRFLDRPALTASLGARLLLGRFSLELGVGAGASSGSADWLAWLEVGYASRPLW
jgi:hypothetical protein